MKRLTQLKFIMRFIHLLLFTSKQIKNEFLICEKRWRMQGKHQRIMQASLLVKRFRLSDQIKLLLYALKFCLICNNCYGIFKLTSEL